MRWVRGTNGDGNKLRRFPEAPRVGAEGSQSHSLCILYNHRIIKCFLGLVFSLVNLEEASTLSLHVRFRVGSDRP